MVRRLAADLAPLAPIGTAEGLLIDLLHLISRQHLDELDEARDLVAGQTIPAPGIEFCECGRCARVDRHDERQQLLTEIWVRDPDDRDIEYAGVLEEHLLTLGRIQVDASRDDHVGHPVGHVDESILVDMADIAEREDAGPHIGLLRLLLVTVIPNPIALGGLECEETLLPRR